MDEQSTEDIVTKIIQEIKNDEESWKNTVQVGDYVDASDDGYYTFSKHKYKTKGKLYKVRHLDFRHNPTVIVYGDYIDPAANGEHEKVWLGPSEVIFRNGIMIWESSIQKSLKVIPPEQLAEHGNESLKIFQVTEIEQ